MPSWLTLKLGAMILGAAAILSFVILAFHWKHTMTERGEKLETICAATRAASNHPKLKCSEVPQQIGFLGEAVGTLTQSLHKQNDAVAAMGAETTAQQKAAADAQKKAAPRASAADATAQRLKQSADKPSGKPCEPSKELENAWR